MKSFKLRVNFVDHMDGFIFLDAGRETILKLDPNPGGDWQFMIGEYFCTIEMLQNLIRLTDEKDIQAKSSAV